MHTKAHERTIGDLYPHINGVRADCGSCITCEMQQPQQDDDDDFRNVRLNYQLLLPLLRTGKGMDLERHKLRTHALGDHNNHVIGLMLRHPSH